MADSPGSVPNLRHRQFKNDVSLTDHHQRAVWRCGGAVVWWTSRPGIRLSPVGVAESCCRFSHLVRDYYSHHVSRHAVLAGAHE